MIPYDGILEGLERADDAAAAEWKPLYKALLSAEARTDIRSCDAAGIAVSAAGRFMQGQPMLAPEDFSVDCRALDGLAREVCSITRRHRPELVDALGCIAAWLEVKPSISLTLAMEYLRDEAEVRRQGEEAGLEGPLLAYVLNHALHPFLREYARVLAPQASNGAWFRRSCPVCGGSPDFAALSPVTGGRRLLCSRCDHEWMYWRTSCPFCEADGPQNCRYLAMDGERYRLYVCERCHRYLKTVDERATEGERLLPLERLVTMNLDVTACMAGYQ